jgi:hypothetical protein
VNEIKAIETKYAGCRFRSRAEARWAVFFDHMGIGWEHEPEGFETSIGRYLPDFRIQTGDWYPYWFEVKPPYAGPDDRHRVLCVETATPMIVARGMPRSYSDQLRRQHSALTAMLWGDRLDGAVVPAGNTRPEVYPAAFVGRDHSMSLSACGMWDSIHKARTFVCSVEAAPHVALYGADHGHHHRPPVQSPDVDAAYRAALSARFGT